MLVLLEPILPVIGDILQVRVSIANPKMYIQENLCSRTCLKIRLDSKTRRIFKLRLPPSSITALATSPLRLPQSIVWYTGEVLLSLHGHLCA